jgi:UDP-3-O-[3-hydroxymyristoyl] glucosamine N-acyltransferase
LKQLVIYGVGSAITADIAETCRRLHVSVAAWVRNVDGPTFQPPGSATIGAADIGPELVSIKFIVPLFTPGYRSAAYKDALTRGLVCPGILVDPTAVVSSTASLVQGCYVNSLANIAAECRIGAFGFVNRNASLGHHAELSEFVSVGPAAVIAGNVRIGRGAVIGAGAIVLPGQEIGANAIVGAGAVVTRPVPPNCVVTGNPAKITKRGIPGYNGLGVN